jgi:hypothetical protein
MKLYTEEQVRELLNEILVLSYSVEDSINSLTPIELPSDEEIEEILYYRSNAYYQGFFDAIFMLRNKIKRDNK